MGYCVIQRWNLSKIHFFCFYTGCSHSTHQASKTTCLLGTENDTIFTLQRPMKKRYYVFLWLSNSPHPFCILTSSDCIFSLSAVPSGGMLILEHSTSGHIIKKAATFLWKLWEISFQEVGWVCLHNFEYTIQKLILSLFPLYLQVRSISSMSVSESTADSLDSMMFRSRREAWGTGMLSRVPGLPSSNLFELRKWMSLWWAALVRVTIAQPLGC